MGSVAHLTVLQKLAEIGTPTGGVRGSAAGIVSRRLVAPAVHAATGLHVRPADPAAQDDAEIFCPFEF